MLDELIDEEKSNESGSVIELYEDTVSSELEDEIELACKVIDSLRDNEISAGVSYENHIYDSDSASVKRITGVVLLATVASSTGEAYTVDWITKDNNVVTLDARQVIELGKLFAAHEAELVHKARALKDKIRAASQISDVWSIQWT